jgi:hypothetical protein
MLKGEYFVGGFGEPLLFLTEVSTTTISWDRIPSVGDDESWYWSNL